MGVDQLTMAAIWDEAIFEEAPPVIGPDWSRDAMMAEAARGRWLHRCDTLEELAGRLDVNAAGLHTTVTEWNSGIDRFKRDHRPRAIEKRPYWGLLCTGGMLLSRGGPRVDEMLRPIIAGQPLEGLYCVGELLGMGQFSGNNFAGGMSVGPALSLGRWIVRELHEQQLFR